MIKSDFESLLSVSGAKNEDFQFYILNEYILYHSD